MGPAYQHRFVSGRGGVEIQAALDGGTRVSLDEIPLGNTSDLAPTWSICKSPKSSRTASDSCCEAKPKGPVAEYSPRRASRYRRLSNKSRPHNHAASPRLQLPRLVPRPNRDFMASKMSQRTLSITWPSTRRQDRDHPAGQVRVQGPPGGLWVGRSRIIGPRWSSPEGPQILVHLLPASMARRLPGPPAHRFGKSGPPAR